MHCPMCKGRLRTVDSRPLNDDTNGIKRRKECIACGSRFNTTEVIYGKIKEGNQKYVPEKLSPRRMDILNFIIHFIEENNYSPTIREISHDLNISSYSTTKDHVDRLKDEGYITFKPHTSRTIKVLKSSDQDEIRRNSNAN